MTKPKKHKVRMHEAEECRRIVVDTAKKCFGIALKSTEMIEGKQRWLVIGRICALLFQQHFQLSMNAATQVMEMLN
jgi:uncharacterized protein Smg (DUF494 family)